MCPGRFERKTGGLLSPNDHYTMSSTVRKPAKGKRKALRPTVAPRRTQRPTSRKYAEASPHGAIMVSEPNAAGSSFPPHVKAFMEALDRLPPAQRMPLLENTLRALRSSALKGKMAKAAAALEAEYRTNKMLTAFTAIDADGFYEAR